MTEEQQAEPVFLDTKFRQKRKQGQYREVEAPQLEGVVADTHAHLQLMDDPALSLMRCAVHGVTFIGTIVDVYEDCANTYYKFNDWKFEAARYTSRFVLRG